MRDTARTWADTAKLMLLDTMCYDTTAIPDPCLTPQVLERKHHWLTTSSATALNDSFVKHDCHFIESHFRTTKKVMGMVLLPETERMCRSGLAGRESRMKKVHLQQGGPKSCPWEPPDVSWNRSPKHRPYVHLLPRQAEPMMWAPLVMLQNRILSGTLK